MVYRVKPTPRRTGQAREQPARRGDPAQCSASTHSYPRGAADGLDLDALCMWICVLCVWGLPRPCRVKRAFTLQRHFAWIPAGPCVMRVHAAVLRAGPTFCSTVYGVGAALSYLHVVSYRISTHIHSSSVEFILAWVVYEPHESQSRKAHTESFCHSNWQQVFQASAVATATNAALSMFPSQAPRLPFPIPHSRRSHDGRKDTHPNASAISWQSSPPVPPPSSHHWPAEPST